MSNRSWPWPRPQVGSSKCRECSAPAGMPCRTPKGSKQVRLHEGRREMRGTRQDTREALPAAHVSSDPFSSFSSSSVREVVNNVGRGKRAR